MAYVIRDAVIGNQAIATTSTVLNHPLGTIVKAFDPTYGEGEFIYLLGAANTVVGLMFTWNATTYQTVIAADTAAEAGSVCWAMSANVASQYGWYQINGLVVALKTNVSFEPQKKAYQSATTGRVMDTSASAKAILGAKSANLATVTTTTSTVVLQVSRPSKQGPVT